MADSFFGFDTSLSNVNDRDDGGGREASEDEYDALNDETFGGSGEDGDWEQQHEELSMLTEVDKHQSDLEAFLSHLVLEEYDEYSSEATSPIPPQPVQQSSAIPNIAQAPPAWLKNACTVEELERNMMRQQQQPPSQQKQQQVNQQQHNMNQQQQLMSQQQMGQQQKLQQTLLLPPQLQQKLQQQKMPQQNVQQNVQQQNMQHPIPQNIQMQHPPQHPAMPMLMPFFQTRFPTGMIPPGLPPPMLGPRPPFLTGPPPPIHPFGNFNQLPPNKMPPGLLRPQHTLTNLQAIEQQQQQNNLHHPNHHPQMNNLQHSIGNMQQPINNMNQPMNNINNLNKINQPLMGGINQGMNKMNPAMNVHMMQQQNQMNINHRSNQQQQIPFKHQNNVQQQMNQNNQKKPNGRSEERVFSQEEVMQIIQETHPLLQKSNMQKFRRPKTLEEFMGNHIQGMQRRGEGDQYSGLMSQREKQWLLNIQLMQLNTGTPYMDDYYYTVFLDRQAKKEKQQEMKEAHKANQQNHPFSQQNLTNNRYHGTSSGNGEGGRERRNSSRSTGDGTSTNKDGPRHYVPTQFENSLGKLQCGSVTAPRKIMDMEVVSDSAAGQGSAGPSGASRSSRQTLLAIESLFRGLLRVEDLSEPLAIANALVLKEREEKQKALLLEQQQRDALEDDETSSSPPNSDSANHFLRGIESVVKNQQQQKEAATSIGSLGSSSQPNLLDENKTELLGKLLAGLLFEDRLAAFLNVRKGKLLVTRILAQATPAEWWRAPLGRLWPRLLRCLPYACRRDAHCLGPIVQHFRSYLNGTEGWAPVSDLCTVLTEGAAQQPSQRANTPALLQQRGLMHFLLSSQLGLSLLVALSERAAALPRPAPAAWTALIRAAAKQALQAPTATAVSVRPVQPLGRGVLATHAVSAGLSVPEEEALSELLC